MSAEAMQTAASFVEQLASDLNNGDLELPMFSGTAVRIQRAFQAEEADIDEIVRLISSDPAIAARVLELANSAAIRGNRQITDLRQAVIRMGDKMVQSSVMSFAMRQVERNAGLSDGSKVALRTIWIESIELAARCQVIAKEYTKLNDFITANTGMSLDLFNGMKPFGVLSLVLAKSASCEDAVAYETEFVKIAKEQNEEVLGLETIESQIAIFDSIPYKDQLDNLLTMAEEGMDKARADLAALDTFHKNEDLEGMYKLASETEEMTAEFSNLLLDDRNKNWIPEIGKFAKDKPTFFGVGALHLPGENGVINLLRKEGYTLTAIK